MSALSGAAGIWATSRFFKTLRRQRTRSPYPSIEQLQNLSIVEQLEDRTLFTATPSFSGGLLTIVGNTNSANTITVTLSGSNIVATDDGVKASAAASSVNLIVIADGAAGNNVNISSSIKDSVVVYGGSGKDYISAGGGPTTVLGESGSDTIIGNGGVNYFQGGEGADSIVGGTGQSTLYGGASNDTLVGGNSKDLIDGGLGNNIASGAAATILNAKTSGTTTPPVTTPPVTTPPVTVPPAVTSASSPDPIPFKDSSLAAKITFAGSTTIYAGMGVEVNATSSTLDVGNPLTAQYQWNFGDTNSGSQYNSYSGWSGGHVYAKAGTYTVTLTVTNQNGVSSTTTAKVTVQATTSLKSIYISPTGNDSNSGTSSSAPIQSIAKLNQLLASNTQVFFQAGKTFNMSTPININAFSNVIITSYGSGAAPILNFVGPSGSTNVSTYQVVAFQNGTQNVAISNLAFTSPYTAKNTPPNGMTPKGTNIAVYNCSFNNMGDDFLLNYSPNGMLIQGDTSMNQNGLQGYFSFTQGSNIVIQGNTAVNTQYQSIIRSDGTTDLFIGFNNFSTSYGCTVAIQIGSYAYVAHNTLNGPNSVGPLQGSADDAEDTWAEWTAFDGNTINDSITGALSVGPSTWHTIFRNNVITANDQFAITVQAPNTTYGDIVTDAEILGNTVINNDQMGGFLRMDVGADGIVVADNLLEAPNLLIGDSGACGIFVDAANLNSFSLIANNIWGYGTAKVSGGLTDLEIISTVTPWQGQGFTTAAAWNATPQVQNDTFTELSLSSAHAPSSSSVAAGGGVWVAGLISDFNGIARTASKVTIGAVQL